MTITSEPDTNARPGTRVMVDEDVEKRRFRVHRSSMTSPSVYGAEVKNVFNHCWLYVGHTSEVPKPGDYVRRPVGGRPMFMVRGSKSGEIRVFHNSCTHRGALVCRTDRGNAKSFQCFYHAWTFSTEGQLIGVPDRDGYEGRDFGDLGLAAPRVEEYRGFVFLSFDPDIVDLQSYLAGAKEYLDLVIDGASDDVEIIRGTHEYGMAANWKLLVENSIDGYHAAPLHATYFQYLASVGTDISAGISGFGRDLGNGHAVVEGGAPWGRPIASWEPSFGPEAKVEIERIRADLVERHGEALASRMANTSRNLLIYPNLIINDIMAVTVRTFMPGAPDHTDITAWQLAPRTELPLLRERRLDNFLTFLGPGGFATPDDIEALESCQSGFTSGGIEWNDISRGMARSPLQSDEEQMRTFWRRWNEQMQQGNSTVRSVS
jgi:p-cumate 2,3-dioxygenase subunit alpha